MRRVRLRKPSAALRARLQTNKHQDWRRKKAKAQGGLCHYCGKHMIAPTLDHVVPLSKGGADHWENVVAACAACNRAKGDNVVA